ncbi:MAG: peroxiredoxin [Actinomycetota bacterium]
MGLEAGQQAPEFEAKDQHGTTHTLSGLLEEGPVVLFFYPKAMTSGCTAESCHFRDLAAEFAEVGAQRIGISADSVDRQKQFDEKNDLGYPLLADEDKSIADAYGTKRWWMPGMNKRQTFVIGTDGMLKAVIASETNMETHADEALAALRD